MSGEISIFALAAGGAGCAAAALYPLAEALAGRSKDRLELYRDAKSLQTSKELDDLFIDVSPRWMNIVYGVAPILAGLAVFALTHRLPFALLGMVAGIMLPDLWVKQRRAIRRRRFRAQLVDALLILSSSLRAGLSLTQAFEQLVSEAGPPASEEFGLMLKAHRLGRTLEESLRGLNTRMACEELELFMTAVLVARETGGDITHVIHQLVTTIRERQKLQDKVKTLTVQGRMQAYILSVLPIAFALFVRTVNPHFFDILVEDPSGRIIIATAAGLWLVGMTILLRISRVRI